MAQLVFIDGVRMGKVVPLADYNRIGSADENEIIVPEPGVLAHHAVISVENGAFRIASENAAALTVNGRETPEENLHHGDIISVGDVTILFSDETSDKAENPPAEPHLETLTTSVVESSIRTFDDPRDALRIIREHERLAEHVEILYRFGAAVSATLRMDDLMDVMIQEIEDICRPDRIFIFLYDESKNLRLQSQRISKESALQGFDRVSRTILNQAVESRESFLTKDATTDEQTNLAQSVVDQNIQSVMAVPLVKKDRILGVIYVDTLTSIRSYTREDLHLLTAIAAQAALAIENVINYATQLDHSRKLSTLGEVARKVSSFLSRSIVIREAAEGGAKVFECRKCTLLLMDEDRKGLTVAHSNHIPRDEWSSILIPAGEGLCGKVFADNKPLLVLDAAQVEGTGKREYDTPSFVIVPVLSRSEGIQAESRPIGVLAVTDKENGRLFDQNDLEFLRVLASHIGIALNNARLYERATVDSLTRVFTRPFFFSQLEEEIIAHRIRKAPLSLLMIDIDHFKKKNDEHGHQIGDVILSQLGQLLREKIIALGLVARYGGEEFVVMLRSTDRERARKVGEVLRTAVENHPFSDPEKPIQCTISVGVGQMEAEDDVDDIVLRADAALYHAKHNGRNRVVVFTDDTPLPNETRLSRKRKRDRPESNQ